MNCSQCQYWDADDSDTKGVCLLKDLYTYTYADHECDEPLIRATARK